ncbi:MAG: M48 family metallopeptidase [Muribaculaceae bacterium]|nr:M48 family metallopeptidase [Muribaculaceae bacterium]
MPIGELQHNVLGRVTVNVRQNSRHVSARWKGGLVSLNVPQGIRVMDINRILDDLAPRLLEARPALTYHDGQELRFPYVDFVIRRQNFAPTKVLGTPSVPVSSVEVGSRFDFDSEATSRAISDMLCKLARHVAPRALLPRARELADRIGRRPVGWTISSGHRTLGRCTATGIISLSYVLVFLPSRLCDYVIYHELAHLSEMNHSPQFHALLDTYLDGKEALLVKELQSYRWPVFRR